MLQSTASATLSSKSPPRNLLWLKLLLLVAHLLPLTVCAAQWLSHLDLGRAETAPVLDTLPIMLAVGGATATGAQVGALMRNAPGRLRGPAPGHGLTRVVYTFAIRPPEHNPHSTT